MMLGTKELTMERNIYLDDELEDFLKEKSDQYKLYPSDRVWNNINRSLHPKFKWSYAILTVFFLFTSSVISDYKYFSTVTVGDRLFKSSNGSQINPAEQLIAAATPKFIIRTNGGDVAEPINGPLQHAAIIPITVPAFIKSTPQSSTWIEELINNAPKEEVLVQEPEIAIVEVPEVTAPVTPRENKTVIISTNKSEEEIIGENVRKVLWAGEPFKRPRLSWQMSFSPTLSYRRLTSGLHEISEVFRGIPYNADKDISSVSQAVTHKPAIGAEAGFGLNYRVSNSFILKAGLQLSYSRYQVKAIPIKYQQALLAVTNTQNHTDSITAMSSLMNFSGEGSEWLSNEYYQLSMPVGFEWQVLGTSSFKWNVAASAQPVYNLSNNVYLLSTDFRNYAQDPSLIRKWNLSAGLETYLSYNISNNLKLQAGPQLRYQLFSSFKNEYPIKEYLIDLGFKVGISKTIR